MAFDEAKVGLQAISKPIFLVILNEVKDLKLLKNTRFFASLRMTFSTNWGF